MSIDVAKMTEVLQEIPADVRSRLPAAYQSRDRADALQVPMQYLGIINQSVFSSLINFRFNRVARTDARGRLHIGQPRAGFVYTIGDIRETEFFALNDPYLPGQPRYDWFEDTADSGVKYGFLRFPDRQ
jgi:hypothetical protein